MFRRTISLCTLVYCCCALSTAFAAPQLSPQARRDLSVLATVYPGLMTAIERAPDGRVSVLLNDGTRLPYDDGQLRNDQQALDTPDIKTMLEQPYPLGPVVAEPTQHMSPGRRRVEAFFLALYGHTKTEVAANCRPMPFFNQTIRFNTRYGAADAFGRVVVDLEALVAQHPQYRPYLLPASGGMVWRTIAGTHRLSVHSFAAAVDVSPRGNPYWRNLPPGTNLLATRQAFPPQIVEAFERQGFIWGGKWAEFDLMHFEYRPEIILLARLARGERIPLVDITPLIR